MKEITNLWLKLIGVNKKCGELNSLRIRLHQAIINGSESAIIFSLKFHNTSTLKIPISTLAGSGDKFIAPGHGCQNLFPISKPLKTN